jgi:hypothetical protein
MSLLQNRLYGAILVDSMTNIPDILMEEDMVAYFEMKMKGGNPSMIDQVLKEAMLWEVNLSKPVGFVKDSTPLEDCLPYFSNTVDGRSSNLLLVVDEQDEVVGVVTAKSLFFYLASDLEYSKLLRDQAMAMQLNTQKYDYDSIRGFLARMLESNCYQVFMGLYLLLDISLALSIIFITIFNPEKQGFQSDFSYEFVGLFTLLILEVLARVFILRREFFYWYPVLDALFIFISFVMALLRSYSLVSYYTYLPFIAFRILFFISQIYNRRLLILPKKLVSGNKTRIKKGEFDLDLTYINDR